MKQHYNKPKYHQTEDCPDGWQCPQLLKQRCKDRHHPEDFDNAKSLKNILKRHPQEHTVIIVKKTQKEENKPICLFDALLPITLLEQPETPLKPDIYYIASFIKVQNRRVILKFIKQLGPFEKYSSVDKILHQFCLPEYFLAERSNQRLDGHVKIIDHTRKMLITKDRPIFLEEIRQYRDYPVLHGSKVEYQLERGIAKLTKIIHPRDLRVSGILQVDHNSIFYLIPRNTDFDDMNPYLVPKDIENLLEKYQLFPYSLFNQNSISKEKQKEINQILKKILVKGYFKAWPLNYRFPVVDLEEEIAERNLKNTKNAIIFESGIEVRPFSRRQKIEADRLADKFKIKNYGKRITAQNVYTIDSKHTKCHDDSVSIQSLPDKRLKVSVHIADAAALIKADSFLDDQIRKRDETIYIKNYHQPMFPQSLKKLLSLTHDKDKLTFSLSFEVTSQGFIDFRTVKFFKSVVKVKQNLAHETLSKQPILFPEIFQFQNLIGKSNLVDSNYIIECQSKSQSAITQLIYLSSIIPTFILEKNLQRCNKVKQDLGNFIKNIIDSKSESMEKWQDEIVNINKNKKQQLKIKKQILQIDKIIKKQLQQKRKQITREITSQQKKIKQQQKKIKKQKKQTRQRQRKARGSKDQQLSDDYSSSEDEQSETTQLEPTQTIGGLSNKQVSVLSKDEKMLLEDISDEKQQELRQKRMKNMKQAKQQQSQSESQLSSDDSQLSDVIGEDEEFKMRNAAGGRKYLETIFSYFKIDLQWKSIKEINEAFSDILGRSKAKLYQEYFKRMQIMNRQHFKYIINIVKKQNKERGYDRKAERQRPERQADRNRNRNRDNRERKQDKIEQIEYIVPQSHVENKKSKYRVKKEQTKQNKQDETEKKQSQSEKIPTEKKQPNRYKLKSNVQKDQTKPEKKNEILQPKMQQKPLKLQAKIIESQAKSQKESSKKEKTQTHAQKRAKAYQQNQSKQDKPQRTRENKNQNKGEKQKDKHQEGEYQLNADQEQIKKKIYEKIRNSAQNYIQKYQQSYHDHTMQVSDDELINQEEHEVAKQILKKCKKAAILLEMRKVERNKNKKQKHRPHQKQPMKDEKDLLLKKNIESSNQKNQNANKIQQKETKKEEDKISQQIQSKEIILPQTTIKNKRFIVPKAQEHEKKQTAKLANTIKDELDYLVKKYLQLSPDSPQQKQIEVKNHKSSQNSNILTKKQLKKKIESLLKEFSLQLKEKYSPQKRELSDKLHQAEQKTTQSSKQLKQELTKASFDYNLIKFIALQEERQEEQQEEPSKKGKNKKKQPKKKKKRSVYSDFLQNFEEYADKANFKFNKMNEDQINSFLQEKFKIQAICEEKQIQKTNRIASKMGENQDELLKWNNPIRSYQALETMRMIKYYSWLFQSDLQPIDILIYGSDIKNIKQDLKQLQKYKDAKLANGDSNKKAKEANRQIAKVEFYNLILKDSRVTHTFLTITSRPRAEHQRVFHPILQQIQIEKSQRPFRGNELYKEVQGRVHVKKDFPLEFTVELI